MVKSTPTTPKKSNEVMIAVALFAFTIGTIGWIATLVDPGSSLIPLAGLGWLEVIGIVLLIPSAIIIKRGYKV